MSSGDDSGWGTSIALTESKEVDGGGYSGYRQLGQIGTFTSPIKVSNINTAVGAALGGTDNTYFTYILKEDGTVSSLYKIYIIPDAQKMTVQAQNALLKTIEEPPAYAVIMLLTTNQDAFLQTILSRCVQLKLKPLKDSVVKTYLEEKLQVKDIQAEIYSAFARGNLGKAIHLAQSEDFKMMYEEILKLLKEIKEMDISQLLDVIRKLKDDNTDIKECLDFMQMWYRDILMYKTTKDLNLLIFKDEFSAVKKAASLSSYEGLEQILGAIDKARVRLDANVNMELVMELLLLTMKEN